MSRKRVVITITSVVYAANYEYVHIPPQREAHQVEFPVGIPDGISREFSWLKGTEWHVSENKVGGTQGPLWGNIVLDKSGNFKVQMDAFQSESNQICQEGGCKWSASRGVIYLVTLEQGLIKFKVNGETPVEQRASKLKGLNLRGVRDEKKVLCGQHHAPNCAGCPQGNGESWCNGECFWNATEAKCASIKKDVSCGSHTAKNCAGCPQGHGADWCNGDCSWNRASGKCVSKTQVTLQAKFVRVVEAVEKGIYEILGLTDDASENDIKKQYRKLSVKYHPDKNPDKESQHLFNEIREAYEILSDPDKKILYDTGGADALTALQKGQVDRGEDLREDLKVKLSDLYNSAKVDGRLNRRIVCRGCRTWPDAPQCRNCRRCPNEHKDVKVQVGPGFFIDQKQAVPSKEKCKLEESSVEVQIEKGMHDGDVVTFPRMGDQQSGMIPGSVVFTIKTENERGFRRRGDDLTLDVQINLEEALIGFQRKLRHLDGHRLEFGVDGVTAPFQVLKIRGEGMPLRDDPTSFGDLYVSVEVMFPKSLTSDQKQHVLAATLAPHTTRFKEEL